MGIGGIVMTHEQNKEMSAILEILNEASRRLTHFPSGGMHKDDFELLNAKDWELEDIIESLTYLIDE